MQHDERDEQLELHAEAILSLLGLDGIEHEEHFRDTPKRFISMMLEFRQDVDLVALLKDGFWHSGPDAVIVQSGIPIAGMCAHHLAPWFGTANIGYLPNHKICGLSKLTRVSQAAGKIRPSTQEEVTNLVADTLQDGLDCKGVIVVTKALHGCMAVRGVNEPSVETTVSALRGIFLTNPAARSEFFDLLKV